MYTNNFVIFAYYEESIKNLSFLKKHLLAYNLEEQVYDDKKVNKPSFIWFRYINEYNQAILNKYYNMPCNVKNILLNIDGICDKYQLYKNMEKYFPDEYIKFMAKSFKLERNTPYVPGSIYITRPINTINNVRCSSGNGILVYDSEDTLNIAKHNLDKYDTIISSEYIKNPLLFQGGKMHLRCHMVITIIDNIYSAYTYDIFKITVAKENYKMTDFQNKDIHDTHYLDINKDLVFPTDFRTENIGTDINNEIIENIYNNIRIICKKMAIVLKTDVKCAKNARNAFHIFGFDILIDNLFNCYLLECNRFCDVTTGNGEQFKMERFFSWINDIVLTPVYNKTRNIESEPSLINTPIYRDNF